MELYAWVLCRMPDFLIDPELRIRASPLPFTATAALRAETAAPAATAPVRRLPNPEQECRAPPCSLHWGSTASYSASLRGPFSHRLCSTAIAYELNFFSTVGRDFSNSYMRRLEARGAEQMTYCQRDHTFLRLRHLILTKYKG
jgi:hypothetical protein